MPERHITGMPSVCRNTAESVITKAVNSHAQTFLRKPWPNGLALAFQDARPGQSPHEAVINNLARLGSAYLGPAWPGSRPQAGPCTSLSESYLPGDEDQEISSCLCVHESKRPIE